MPRSDRIRNAYKWGNLRHGRESGYNYTDTNGKRNNGEIDEKTGDDTYAVGL